MSGLSLRAPLATAALLLAFAAAAPPARGQVAPVEIVPQLGHSEEINAFALTADGRFAVTSAEHALLVWDLVTRKELRTLPGGAYHPQLRLLPDSRTALQIGADKSAHAFDLRTGAVLAELGPAKTLAVSIDGRLAAVGAPDKTISIFELPGGKRRNSFPDPAPAPADQLAFTPDGAQLVIGHADRVPQLWDAANGTLVRPLDGFHGPSIGFAFSADGKFLASADGNGSQWYSDSQSYLTLLDAKTFQRIRSQAWESVPQDVSFSPDSTLAVSQQYKALGQPMIWDVATGNQRCTIAATLALNRFSADGKQVIGVRNDHLDIYDAATCKKVESLSSQGALISGAALSADGNTLVVKTPYALQLWDLAGLRYKRTLKRPGVLNAFALSSNGRTILVTDADDLALLDAETGAVTKTYPGKNTILSVSMSQDSKTAIAGTTADAVVYDLATGKVLRTFAEVGWTDQVVLSPKGERALLVGHHDELRLVDLKSDAPPKLLELGEGKRGCAAFSPDGKQVAFGGTDNLVGTIDLTTGKVRHFAGHTSWVLSVDFSPDGKQLASASFDGTVRVWDLATGQALQVLTDHHANLFTARFTPDGKRLVSSGADGTTRIWPLASYSPVTLLANATDWIVYTREGYFDSSLHGSGLVAVTQGMDDFAVEQFALRYNRPDLVFKKLGLGSPELLEHYHALYMKRLKRAGLKEEEFSKALEPPKAKILKAVLNDGMLALEASCSPAHAPLQVYNVYDNGVPVYAPPGKPMQATQSEIKESIALSPGTNRIELACTDAGGAESYRALVVEEYKSDAKPDLYYLGLGVSKYLDPSLALGYADKDARDIGEAFGKMRGYANVHIKVLANEEATVPALQQAKEFFLAARAGDTVVLFVAGHGVHATDKEGTYYFLTHEAKVADLAHSAAAFETIEDLLQGLTARNKLFLLDTCESGEQEEPAAPPPDSPVHLTSRGVRGLKRVSGPSARPLRGYLLERDRYIYDNLSRRSGAIVFSSSRGGEYSYESSDYANGAFSAELLKALRSPVADTDKDGFVSSDELRVYVSGAVPTLTQDRQHPTVDRDNVYQKLQFALPAAP